MKLGYYINIGECNYLFQEGWEVRVNVQADSKIHELNSDGYDAAIAAGNGCRGRGPD